MGVKVVYRTKELEEQQARWSETIFAARVPRRAIHKFILMPILMMCMFHLQPNLERNLARRILLQALQPRTVFEAITQHGDDHCDGPGMYVCFRLITNNY